MVFLGVDAGGTKTSYVLSDENGRILGRHTAGSGGFLGLGGDGLKKHLEEGVAAVLQTAGLKREDLTAAGFGFPGYGEMEGSEEIIDRVCEEVSGPGKAACDCDCYIGWAGSLAMEPGINIIAGTGANCYGVNADGQADRCNGWGAYGDEGSCRWIGGSLLAAFERQSDGREPRTALYDLVRERLEIQNDLHFIHTLNRKYGASGKETAKLQLIAMELAYLGDERVRRIYREAAAEHALAAHTVARKLGIADQDYKVSYSGGLFKAGDCILGPLGEEVAARGGVLCTPRVEPDLGAVWFAMRHAKPDWDLTSFTFTEQ